MIKNWQNIQIKKIFLLKKNKGIHLISIKKEAD